MLLSIVFSKGSDMARTLKLLCALSIALASSHMVSGCASNEEQEDMRLVVNAAEDQVKGCLFLGNFETTPRATIENARYDLKLITVRRGGTHMVERYAYADLMNRLSDDMGIAITARIYKCPAGKGSTVDNPASRVKLEYDLPQPSVNNDDPLFFR